MLVCCIDFFYPPAQSSRSLERKNEDDSSADEKDVSWTNSIPLRLAVSILNANKFLITNQQKDDDDFTEDIQDDESQEEDETQKVAETESPKETEPRRRKARKAD